MLSALGSILETLLVIVAFLALMVWYVWAMIYPIGRDDGKVRSVGEWFRNAGESLRALNLFVIAWEIAQGRARLRDFPMAVFMWAWLATGVGWIILCLLLILQFGFGVDVRSRI